MEKLSIENALKLIDILYPYIPETADDGLDFIGKIVSNIKNTKPIDYLNALSIMLDNSVQDILTHYTPEESVELFGIGLAENDIIDLKSFYERLTNG